MTAVIIISAVIIAVSFFVVVIIDIPPEDILSGNSDPVYTFYELTLQNQIEQQNRRYKHNTSGHDTGCIQNVARPNAEK